MRSSWFQESEKTRIYRENLRSLREAADELLSHMKGHDWSFRQEITDELGNFSQEKLCGLVDEMLSLWAEDLRGGSCKDPAAGESAAELYLKPRLELYRPYLYLVMRCSLCKGGYSDARDGAEEEERTDFAFLLEQAKRLSRDWCVIAGPDGERRSEPYSGFDRHFGFHLYRALRDPDGAYGSNGNDWSLTPDWKQACAQPTHLLTDEGNTKRISIRQLPGAGRRAEKAAVLPPEEDYDDEDEYWDDPDQVFEGYVLEEDDEFWDFWAADTEFRLAEMERLSAESTREQDLTLLLLRFECTREYLSACDEFTKRFGAAGLEVLRDFDTDLEAIVDLYLLKREIPPLMDADKTLDVYNRICGGALRQAKRYGRQIQWKEL